MTKLNKVGTRARPGVGPIASEPAPTLRTALGAPGYARDAKSELFLLAVTNMVGEATFHEGAAARDNRFGALVRDVAVADPAWMLSFVTWLRGDGNMRTASIVAAAEAVKARLDAGTEQAMPVGAYTARPGDPLGGGLRANPATNRQIIAAALQRADEPGELLAYWMSAHGRAVPKPVKRGIGDAVQRLYNEYNLLKYDTASHAVRFGDVLDLTHPAPVTPDQGALFRYALDRRHGRSWDEMQLNALPMVVANGLLRADAMSDDPKRTRRGLDADTLKAAGFTWEDALSLAGSKVDKRKLWEALIPTMGYMALLRNLRNFDEADVSDTVAQAAAARLADPAQVAKSRQLPMRFLSAYRAVPSLRWGHALDVALGHSLANVPALPGRTLILVDTSSSMEGGFSKDGTLKRWDAAALFGIALGRRCAYADVVSYSSAQRFWGDSAGARTKVFPPVKGESLLRSVERWGKGGWFLGGGTDTAGAVRQHHQQHDRVIILTDEQHGADHGEVTRAVPATTPLHVANLAGYEAGGMPSGPYRHVYGGLTDAVFRIIPLVEAGRGGDWPWMVGTEADRG